MTRQTLFGSQSFTKVASGLLALHRLVKVGQEDTPEADSIRDALDAPLMALNPTEKKRAQLLSEDLYSVSEPLSGSNQKVMNPQAQQKLIEAYEAKESGDWDRALALLRRWKDYISPELLSYLRGSIWLSAGNPSVATMFYEHAMESDPENANYRAIYLHALAESNPEQADNLACEILVNHEKNEPIVVARAALIRFNKLENSLGLHSIKLSRDLIPILERNMERIENDEDTMRQKTLYAMTTGVLGFCHELQGNKTVAAQYYSRGILENPENSALLVARGILLYGTSPVAISDFEQALELNSPLIWPSFFLAHHYLLNNKYDQCRTMCESGLRLEGNAATIGQLKEWLAISYAELGFSPQLVRFAFEDALRIDPLNKLAKRNLECYESFINKQLGCETLLWEQKPIADIRQFGLAERPYFWAA